MKIPESLVKGILKGLSTITFDSNFFSKPLASLEQFLSQDEIDATSFNNCVGMGPFVDVRESLREMVGFQSLS